MLAHVAPDRQGLVAGDHDVVAVHLGPQAEALEHQADHVEIGGPAGLDAQLPAGDAGEGHEGRDLDVVGPHLVLAAPQPLDAVDGQQVGADPLDVGAHLHEHPREVLHVRLAGRVVHDRGAGR